MTDSEGETVGQSKSSEGTTKVQSKSSEGTTEGQSKSSEQQQRHLRSQGGVAKLVRQQQGQLAAVSSQCARARLLKKRDTDAAPGPRLLHRHVTAITDMWSQCETTHIELLGSLDDPSVEKYLT